LASLLHDHQRYGIVSTVAQAHVRVFDAGVPRSPRGFAVEVESRGAPPLAYDLDLLEKPAVIQRQRGGRGSFGRVSTRQVRTGITPDETVLPLGFCEDRAFGGRRFFESCEIDPNAHDSLTPKRDS
jgi:hypothetical protein